MIRLFRMYMYRMIHSKATWVILLVATGLFVFALTISKIATQYSFDDNIVISEVESTDGEEMTEVMDDTIMNQIIGIFKSGTILIFTMIYTVLFIMADEKFGYIKNIATTTKHRVNLVLTKMIALAIYNLVFSVVISTVVAILYKLYFPDMLFGFSASSITMLFIIYLLSTACMSFAAFVTGWCRNTGLGMTAAILIISGFASMITGLLNQVIYLIWNDATLNMNNLLTTYRMSMLPDSNVDGAWTTAIILSLIYLILWNGIHMFIVKKRDIV